MPAVPKSANSEDGIHASSMGQARSECIPLVRRMLSGRVSEDSISEARAVIGMCTQHWVTKFYRRQHMLGGPRVIRKSTCGSYPTACWKSTPLSASAQYARPGETCAAEYEQGGGVFPDPTGRKFSGRMGGVAGERLGAHGLRRGAARAILESGAGQWCSSAYRLFLNLGVEETAATASRGGRGGNKAEPGGAGGEIPWTYFLSVSDPK